MDWNLAPLRNHKSERGNTHQRKFIAMPNFLKNQLEEINDPKREKMVSKALEFGKQNKNALVIICDPKTDEIAMTYKNKYSIARLVFNIPLLKIKRGVIKKILYSKDSKEKDKNIFQLMSIVGGFIARATGKFKEERETPEKQTEELKQRSAVVLSNNQPINK